MVKITKRQQKIMEAWTWKNGACEFDYKNQDIIFPDGGLFSIQKKKCKTSKLVGWKKLPNNCVKAIFDKKKTIPFETYDATIWITDLDDMINYLTRMKKMLNGLGIKTSWKKLKN